MTRDPTDDERLDWLRLYRSENVGPVAFRRLIARFGSAGTALDALPDLARCGGARRKPVVASRAVAEREYEAVAAIGARLLILPDTDYPPLLRTLSDAPPILCVLGRPDLPSRRSVAVVGARNASTSGRRIAATIARDLADMGFTVVSGLARGIDAAAHAGAGASRTVAVMAGGADVAYPRDNASLHAAIRENGCLISEMPPGTEPQARHFPRRNRIVSGLSEGTIVVEATARSGSLITARLAAEQGREVMAVPGSPADPRSAGPNHLIKDGAALIENAQDVALVLERPPREDLFSGLDEAGTPPVPSRLAVMPESDSGLEKKRLRLLESLTTAPLPVDVALRQCQLSAAEGAVALLELELAGRIEHLPGQMIALIPNP